MLPLPNVRLNEVGSKWIIGTHGFHDESYDYSGTIPDESCSDNILTITKDTIIGDLNLKKVEGYNSYELLNFDDNKISFYKRDSLYTYMDANANVGDTIIVSKNYIPYFFENVSFVDTIYSLGYVITEIDSIDLNGSKYLRQKEETLNGGINGNKFSYSDFGVLIYPFGSVYSGGEQVSIHNMSMLGGYQDYFTGEYYYYSIQNIMRPMMKL